MPVTKPPCLVGFSGASGAGKTTLITALIELLCARDYRVSALKWVHQAVDLDSPGKDSYRYRQAGAQEIAVANDHRWFLQSTAPADDSMSVDRLLARMAPSDFVLVEGFNHHTLPRLVVWRQALAKPLRITDDTIAIVTTEPDQAPGDLPVFDLNQPTTVAEFIIDLYQTL